MLGIMTVVYSLLLTSKVHCLACFNYACFIIECYMQQRQRVITEVGQESNCDQFQIHCVHFEQWDPGQYLQVRSSRIK